MLMNALTGYITVMSWLNVQRRKEDFHVNVNLAAPVTESYVKVIC